MQYTFSLRDDFDLAAKKVNIPGWRGHTFRSADCGGCIIEGCVPDGVYASGPRKGKPRFTGKGVKEKRTVIITNAEQCTEARRYEAATDKCWNCKGSGNEWAGWGREGGNRYRKCQRCGGSGKRVVAEVAEVEVSRGKA